MPSCNFCDHDNPAGTRICASCGAELPGAMEREQSPAPSPAPEQNLGGLEQEVLAILKGGTKIEAIKVYRQRTGVGLKEAKDAVEALAARYGVVSKSGCAGVLAVVVFLGWVVVEFVV